MLKHFGLAKESECEETVSAYCCKKLRAIVCLKDVRQTGLNPAKDTARNPQCNLQFVRLSFYLIYVIVIAL